MKGIMKNIGWFLLILLLLCVSKEAFADDASASGAIFTGLADRAAKIGKGLRNSGFLIAGFGLIVFAFMAIFNKISWKMLAYIMMCSFILSAMVSVISYFSNGRSNVRFGDVQNVSLGFNDTYGSMDPTEAIVVKETGEAKLGTGTGGTLPNPDDTIDGGTIGEVVVVGQKKNP